MRALIIEDDPYISEALTTALIKERLLVDAAPDGDTGAFFAKTNDYDIVLLDLMLPKKDGLAVCREIREHGKTTAILTLSARSDTGSKIALLNAGVDDYLAKPFSMEEVVARVRALLRRPKVIQGDTLSIDDLVVDTRSQTVRRDGKLIPLTRKEFMLLEYLIRNRDAVVSRNMLMEHVWDMSLDPFSNTIEAHVMSLRKKIGNAKKRKLIHTVTGSGYKLAVS